MQCVGDVCLLVSGPLGAGYVLVALWVAYSGLLGRAFVAMAGLSLNRWWVRSIAPSNDLCVFPTREPVLVWIRVAEVPQ